MRWPLVFLPCIPTCLYFFLVFFFNDTATTEIYTLSLHDALPISLTPLPAPSAWRDPCARSLNATAVTPGSRGANSPAVRHRVCSLRKRAVDPLRLAPAISRLSTPARRRLAARAVGALHRRNLPDLCNARLDLARPGAAATRGWGR